MTNDPNARSDRINGEMLDTIDEELEMEIDDDRLAKLLTEMAERPQPETLDRRVYFKELLRLQGELVKLQDWIVHHKLKVGSRRCRLPASANEPSGIFSATWHIFRPAEKSSCSTAAGTTAPASSG